MGARFGVTWLCSPCGPNIYSTLFFKNLQTTFAFAKVKHDAGKGNEGQEKAH